MVVFWKETLGRQPQIITSEEEEIRQIILLRQPSLMILMFLLDPVDLLDLLNHQNGLQLHHLLVRERVEPRSPSRERYL